MWIVRIALQRPYTFIVMSILILLLGVYAVLRSAADIFPSIKIPVVAAIWSYVGLPPIDMANRIVITTERTAQTTVNDVEHTESQSLNGVAVVKYFFQPGVDEDLSFGQITGVSQTLLRLAPPGTTPPFILAYDASTVPIVQIALSSDTLSEAQIFDLSNTLRWQAASGRGGSESLGAARPWAVGCRCHKRDQQPESDPACRHREDR